MAPAIASWKVKDDKIKVGTFVSSFTYRTDRRIRFCLVMPPKHSLDSNSWCINPFYHGKIPEYFFIYLARSGIQVVRNCPKDIQQQIPNTAEIVRGLINNCSYDRLRPPPTSGSQPVKVFVKIYFYFLKSYEAHNLQFTVYMLLQCRFRDPRLSFDPADHNVTAIVGTKELSQMLWVPHIYFSNERSSVVMGPGESDVMAHIIHDGTIMYTKRMHATLFCWMKLQKFPFDSQECSLVLDSWSYNTTYLTLEWEKDNPVLCRDKLTLTEFSLIGEPIVSSAVDKVDFDKDELGDFQGNYSSLIVTFRLQRESGFYIYDYFIPSILLVTVSWVSFWLEADAPLVSGRVVLGTSTMLAFIILSLQTGNSIPKVSYIKASEIWFMGCTAFIFGSLVEFAFVNIIYRSGRKQIKLKKLNSKYVLKETLTPNNTSPLRRNSSFTASGIRDNAFLGRSRKRSASLPDVSRLREKLTMEQRRNPPRRKMGKNGKEQVPPTLMTSKEISIWIDERSRVLFPVSFLCFVVLYWCYVYLI